MSDSPTLELAKELISKSSITPNDADCQQIIAGRLKKLGFEITHLPFDDVKNIWAKKGDSKPVLVFAGHTDVVPPGPLDLWTSNPFTPEIRDNKLFGRGAADMKSSLAAMMIACEKFIKKYPQHNGSIAFLITSDEEGKAINGTKKVVDYLKQQKQKIDYCVIGEASCEKKFGDTIKIGRRGSLNGKLIIHGKQGHIAYPHIADNPINKAAAIIHALNSIKWPAGDKNFPATSFQISNIHAGTGADNVIPGHIEMIFNFRYPPTTSVANLQKKVNSILKKYKVKFKLEWNNSSQPFFTNSKKLIPTISQAISEVTKIKPKRSTAGGTSDGRFICDLDCEIVEFGPLNESIHQINENILVTDLEKLTEIYFKTMERLLQ